MWHLKVLQKHTEIIDFQFLFHSVNDVSRYILLNIEDTLLFDYRFTFVPIWDEKKKSAPTEISDHPFRFPEPMSSGG